MKTALSMPSRKRPTSTSRCGRRESASSTPTGASAWSRSRRLFMVDFLSFRDDEATQAPTVTLESFQGQSNATAVRLEPGQDVRELLPYLARISLVGVTFPRSATRRLGKRWVR